MPWELWLGLSLACAIVKAAVESNACLVSDEFDKSLPCDYVAKVS